MTWAETLDDLPISAEEALRWLYRHSARLDFDEVDGSEEVRLTVALRHPEGELHTARAVVPSPGRALFAALDLVGRTRDVVNLE